MLPSPSRFRGRGFAAEVCRSPPGPPRVRQRLRGGAARSRWERGDRTASASASGIRATRAAAPRPQWWRGARTGARAAARGRPASWRAEVDPHLVARTGPEEVGRAPAADRDRDVRVRVLVEDDVARARVREGACGDRVVALQGK